MDLKPLHSLALTMGGEHMLGTDPLIMAGLVHRGEPYISNLEGIKKDRLMTTKLSSFWSKLMDSLFGDYVRASADVISSISGLNR